MTARRRSGLAAILIAAALHGCGADAPDAPPPQVPETTPAPASAPEAPAWPRDAYRRAIDEGVEALLASDPIRASTLGDHRFDDRWPDLGIDAERRTIERYRASSSALRGLIASVPADLSGADVSDVGTDHPALDATLLADHLEGKAFERSELARVEKDPSAVIEIVGQGITSLTTHDYAPARARYASLATRLGGVAELLGVARGRLKKASRAGYENVLITEPGLARALRGEVAATDAKTLDGDAALCDRLRAAALAAAAALDSYVEDVKRSFPVASLDATPIGAEKWARLARLEEGVAESPDEVRRMGTAELDRLTRELDVIMDDSPKDPRRGAARAAPNGPKERAAFLQALGTSALPEDKILAQYRYVNQGVEAWLRAHPFVTIPWDRAKLTIVQTPPQGRGTSFASMNEAGPLEPVATDARFEVNIPDPSMPKPQRDALRGFHSLGAIDLVSIHEALPGHYLQGLHLSGLPSKVRKVLWASTLGEGWAHYCEQAVLDAGYTGDEAVRTKAFAIRMALQRAARVVVDVGENDGTLSFDEGAKVLEERALLSHEAARIEARRALVRPVNMFSYTYGKLAIMRLRRAVEAREGKAFDLVRFHDRLLGVGTIPVSYVAKTAFGLD